MKPKFTYFYITVLFCLCMLTGCRGSNDLPHGAAMYYWRSEFKLDSIQRGFIVDHNIKRLYIKFFDVSMQSSVPQPLATVSFADSLPAGIGYVPVVYITNDCFSLPKPALHRLILKRVRDMASTHDLPAPDEIQIDCDWTRSTRANFFEFMDSLCVAAHDADMRVSTTIRLHQLADTPPVADYGVLMVYNTGSLKDAKGSNPILTKEAVEPYLKHLDNYKLPLVAAYPNFRWLALYAPGPKGRYEFRALLYGADPANTPYMFQPSTDGEWVAIRSFRMHTAIGAQQNTVLVVPGMKVRMYAPPSFDTMQEIESALDRHNSDINSSVILFDINSSNLNIFPKAEYDKIFNP